MTDRELQVALAKKLPEKMGTTSGQGRGAIHWKGKSPSGGFVRETEWFHVCWMCVVADTKHALSRRIEARSNWLGIPVCKLQWQDWAEEILFIGPEDEESFRPKQRAEAVCKEKGNT